MSFSLYNRSQESFETLLPEKAIVSTPPTGQYRIKEIRLDADKKLVIVYDTVAEP